MKKLNSVFVMLLFVIGMVANVASIEKTDFDSGTVNIVFGENAAASDVVGGVDIAYALTAMQTEEPVVITGETKEVSFNANIDWTLDNSELDFLAEDEFMFDGKNYDFEEKIYLDGVEIGTSSMHDADFEDDPYMIVTSRNSVKYLYEIEDTFDLDKVDADEVLTLDILGKRFKIVEVSESSFSYLTGTEYYLKNGNKVISCGKTVTVESIGQSSIIVDVDGVKEIVGKDETDKVNGIKVMVNEIFYHNEANDCGVQITVGEEIEKEIDNNDKVENYEDWKWIVDFEENAVSTIGVRYNEILKSDDEALMEGESLSFPNEFAHLIFKEYSRPEYFEFEFTIESEYLIVDGNRESFNDEFNELWINITDGKIYDEEVNYIGMDVELSDTELTLISNGTTITIGDVEIANDLSNVLVDGDSKADVSQDVLSTYGIVVVSPEDNMPTELTLKVPEEQVEAEVNVNNVGANVFEVEEVTGVALSIEGTIDSQLIGTEDVLIVVGGPAINSVAKEYLGSEWNYIEGESVVELKRDGDKTILVIAGTTAADTTRACDLVANYFKGYNTHFSDGSSFKITSVDGSIVVE